MPLIPHTITDEERLNWLRLFRSEHIGPRTFYSILELYGTATQAIEAMPHLSRRIKARKNIALCSREAAEKEMSSYASFGARVLAACEPDYPPMLRMVEDAPPVITLLGNIKMLKNKECVAIVGARNASTLACQFAYKTAAELGDRGYIVVSGLARGIDTAAHKGSIKTGTVAVIAGGINHIYPPENIELFQRIAAEGVVIAEQPMGTVAKARNFPQRNRIIAGLSRGTCVVEAAFGSGSLITAKIALEQSREVFAVPGSPLDPRCHGTNNLIKEGAILTQSAKDIIRGLPQLREEHLFEKQESAFIAPAKTLPSDEELDRIRPEIIARLSPSPVGVDELMAQTGFTPNQVLTILLELELAGSVERHPGNRVSLLACESLLVLGS
jgi:DNA processing protein